MTRAWSRGFGADQRARLVLNTLYAQVAAVAEALSREAQTRRTELDRA